MSRSREELIQKLVAEEPAEMRARLFGMSMSDNVAMMPRPLVELLAAEITTICVSLIHTCMRHPEWMMAVVRDTEWFKEISVEEYEEVLETVLLMYPLPRMEVRDGLAAEVE
jgi:hypothetical protein